MIRIYSDGQQITYTAGDSFSINITSADEFEQGTTLNFQIAQNEQAESLINKLFDLSDDSFEIILSQEDIKALSIGSYIYKIAVINPQGNITTQKSGDFIVKWGA